MKKLLDFFSGKKTYIAGGAGILYALLKKFGWLPDGMSEAEMSQFIMTLVAFAGMIFLRLGIKKS